MDLLDTVAHLYENNTLSDDIEQPILQSLPIEYRENSEFCEQTEHCSSTFERFGRYERDDNMAYDSNDTSVDITSLVENLNGVLRQRINAEIENFRVSVNEIVDDQQMNFRSMFGLQENLEPAQEVPMHLYSRSSSADNIASDYQVVVEKQTDQMSVSESPASTFNSYGVSESEQG